MSFDILKRHFTKIGAALEIKVMSATAPEFRRLRRLARGPRVDYLLDVANDRQGERFALTLRDDIVDKLEFLVVDLQPQQRHLLLHLKRWGAEVERPKEKLGRSPSPGR